MSASDGAWTHWDTPPWGPHAIGIDAARGQIVAFAIVDSTVGIWTTPLDAPTSWAPVSASGPVPAAYPTFTMTPGPAAANAFLDSLGDRLIVVLDPVDGVSPPQLWSFSLSAHTWSLHDGGPQLSERAIAFDRRRNRLLFYGGLRHVGGNIGNDMFDQMWALHLDGEPSWVELQPQGTHPIGRAYASAAFDAAHDRLLVHGGIEQSPAPTVDETWELSFATDPPTWRFLTPTGPVPLARYSDFLLADDANHRLLCFGGFAPSTQSLTPRSDTWSMDLDASGATWTPITPLGVPAPAAGGNSAYDAVGHRWFIPFSATTQYGRVLQQLTTTSTPTWSLALEDSLGPPVEQLQSATMDVPRNRVLALEHADIAGNRPLLWAREVSPTAHWQRLGRLDHDLTHLQGAIQYDPLSDRLLVFDGGLFSPTDTTGIRVSQVNLAGPAVETPVTVLGPPPPKRDGMHIAYDAAHTRILLFGGTYSDTLVHILPPDVWALQLNGAPTWTRLATKGPLPIPLPWQSFVIDPSRNELVVADPLNDIAPPDSWTLSLDSLTWAPLRGPSSSESFETFGQSCFDAAGDRVLWPVKLPGPAGGLLAYDRATDLWHTWGPLRRPPPIQNDLALLPTAAPNKFVAVTGGGSGMWLLDFGSTLAPTISLVDQSLAQGTLNLHWSSPDRSVYTARLQSRVDRGAWTDQGTLRAQAESEFITQVSIAAPGLYEFRLAVSSSHGDLYLGATQLDVTAAPGTGIDPGRAILRALTNPARRNLTMQFFVPAAQYDPKANLELFDIFGRRLRTHVIGFVGGAWQTVDLGAGLDLRPGVYIVRLAQHGIGEIHVRVVVL